MAKKKPATAIVEGQQFIDDLAGSLIEKWKNEPIWSSRNVLASDVANGIEKLLSSRLLDLDVLMAIPKADLRVKLAMAAIKGFQRLGDLEVDGIFGRRTSRRMNQFNACDEENKSTHNMPGNAPGDPRKGEGLLFYYVGPEVRDLSIEGGRSTQSIISDAVTNWTLNIKLTLREADKEGDANIILKMDNLGRVGGVLGIAHIGGPGINQRLVLRFDENESWTENMFLNTAMHEMGHILGLKHSNRPGFLMSPFQNGLTAPTEQDLARMRAKWGTA